MPVVQAKSMPQRIVASLLALLDVLLIYTDDGPRRAAEVIDSWQRQDFEALDGPLRRVAGQPVKPKHLRFWLERGRGHSKTGDIAISAMWVLLSSQRKIDGVVCAADRDQAALIRDAMDRLLRANAWLAQAVEVQTSKVVNKHTGSTLTILAADVASSYGLLIDFAILDEVTHWPKRDLFDSIFSAIAKRRYGLLLVIANAGYKNHWSYLLRESVRIDTAWYFHRLDGCCASWISEAHLAEQRRILLPKEFNRLWKNDWVDASGDVIPAEHIAKQTKGVGPHYGRKPGYEFYVAGVDLSSTVNRSAIAVFGIAFDRPVSLAEVKSWSPHEYANRHEFLERLRSDIRDLHRRYNICTVAFDQHQSFGNSD